MARIVVDVVDSSDLDLVISATEVLYNMTCSVEHAVGSTNYRNTYSKADKDAVADLATKIADFETLYDGDVAGLTSPVRECVFSFCVTTSASLGTANTAIAGSNLDSTSYDDLS